MENHQYDQGTQSESQVQVAPEQHFEPEHHAEHEHEQQHAEAALQTEQQATGPAAEQAAEPEVLALSVDDFSALEERVLRTVNLVKHERQARASAEERAAIAELVLSEQTPLTERLQSEVKVLHAERDHVRLRVERLLAQLDSLEL